MTAIYKKGKVYEDVKSLFLVNFHSLNRSGQPIKSCNTLIYKKES